MDFSIWEPIYLQILQDFGFERKDDERAALILSHLIVENYDLQILHNLIFNKHILVCGNGPGLSRELESVDLENYVIIAADGATTSVMDIGRIPDIIVTDLDGDIETEIAASEQGSIVVVHAHGNNIGKLIKYVPKIKNIIGSTQAAPLQNIFNFGGFTDGDRAVYVAHEFKAACINLIGFTFDDPLVSDIKKKKLQWAHRLIHNLNVKKC